MSSVVNPVGPESSSVYWRRRLVVLVVVAVLLLVFLKACVLDGDSASDDAPPAAPTTTAPATTQTASTPTPASDATNSPTARATNTVAADDLQPCADDVIAVSSAVANEQYPVGGPVPIRFAVRTTGDRPCTRDVGAAENTVTISSDGRRIWSSDDCTPGGNPDVRTLVPGESFAVTVTWQGDISDPSCAAVRPKAPSGNYQVVGRNGGVTGGPDTFTLG